MTIKSKKQKMMVTAIAGAMAAAIAVGGGTFAYLQSQTEEVKNKFKTEQVNVEISETPADYDIIPGTVQEKDPTLKITNTVESFLYVKVTDNTHGLVTYALADGWEKLDGYEDVYYKKIAPQFDGEGNAVQQEFNILDGNQVSYDKALVNEDMLDDEGNLLTDVALSFEGFAIQARPFLGDYTNTESKAAVYAYTQTTPISTQEELDSALANATEGDTITLGEGTFTLPADISNVRIVGVSPEKTIVDAGNIFDKTNTVDISNVTFKKPDGKDRVLKFKGEGKFKNCVFDNINESCALYQAVATGDTTFEDCTFDGNYILEKVSNCFIDELTIKNCRGISTLRDPTASTIHISLSTELFRIYYTRMIL